MKFNGTPPVEEVAGAVYAAISAEGASVGGSRKSTRTDGGRVMDILGVLGYKLEEYEILFWNGKIGRGDVESTAAFDEMGTEEVNAMVSFAKRQTVAGISAPVDDFHYGLSEEALGFLRRVGKRMRNSIPSLEAMALAYVACSEEGMMYERIS